MADEPLDITSQVMERLRLIAPDAVARAEAEVKAEMLTQYAKQLEKQIAELTASEPADGLAGQSAPTQTGEPK